MKSPGYRSRFFWGVRDRPALSAALDATFASLSHEHGWFASDNLVAWGRNLGFLDDQDMMTAWHKHAEQNHERGILWRTATLVWAARQALRRPGAFVECGAYRGTTAHILLDAVALERPFYLYDLFETAESELPEHGPDLYPFVQARFADHPNMVITKGHVPESLANAPDQIAFLHIDMNSAQAELAAVEVLVDRMVPGAVLILDDYGWIRYREQFVVLRDWFKARGMPVLELPTGQGMVVA